MDKKRNPVLVIVFSLISFGIYFLYWSYKVQVSLHEKDPNGVCGGGAHIVGMLFGCGIYALYWWFKTGKRLNAAGAPKDNGVLYLILALCGIGGIVNPILIQGDINNLIDGGAA